MANHTTTDGQRPCVTRTSTVNSLNSRGQQGRTESVCVCAPYAPQHCGSVSSPPMCTCSSGNTVASSANRRASTRYTYRHPPPRSVLRNRTALLRDSSDGCPGLSFFPRPKDSARTKGLCKKAKREDMGLTSSELTSRQSLCTPHVSASAVGVGVSGGASSGLASSSAVACAGSVTSGTTRRPRARA